MIQPLQTERSTRSDVSGGRFKNKGEGATGHVEVFKVARFSARPQRLIMGRGNSLQHGSLFVDVLICKRDTFGTSICSAEQPKHFPAASSFIT